MKISKLLMIILILILTFPLITWSQKISSPFSQAKFVPNISAILDFSYIYTDLDNAQLERMYLPGYTAINQSFSPNGFNLNYLELAIESVVDPYFDLFGVFQFIDGEFSIEEAFFRTRDLPAGFKLKGGKFFSGFGRLNSQHDHIWNFSDQPLVYRAIFGSINLNDLGLQLNWVAPTDIYISLGFEVFQGENQDSTTFFNEDFKVGSREIKKSSLPLMVGFIKSSIDLDTLTILGGVSLAAGKQNTYCAETGYGISSDNIVLGIDLTFKYYIDSYRYLSFQNEFLLRNMKGKRILETAEEELDQSQWGFYSELIYRYNRRWRCGIRYDVLEGENDLYLENTGELTGNLHKYSGMLEYNPSEFSRIRVQVNYSKAMMLDNQLKGYFEAFLNFNLAIGAHGAHKF